jgi:glucose/arabinose dehydrogenase
MVRFGYVLMILMIALTACSTTAETPPDAIPTATSFQPLPATAADTPQTIRGGTASAPPPTTPVIIPDPASAVWTRVLDGFNRPVSITNAGDSRLFVVEQRGMIWIVQDGERQPEPFLDIRSRVEDRGNEQGLLGLAFHPAYMTNGSFFLNYTGAGGTTHIVRYRVSGDPNRADPSSEQQLLLVDQPYANHNGGVLAFGPDGYLYIGVGDGGSAGDPQGNGQRLDTLLGKILRIDVDGGSPYAIPESNPWADGGGRLEIWAYGLRNPWRIAFDTLRGDLFIGDVGQGSMEEIDYQPAGDPGGQNYGWNLREGTLAYAGAAAPAMVDPVAEYDHSRGCSVTGGVVIRDSRLPEWAGVYLYGDFCTGQIWGLRTDGNGGWLQADLWGTAYQISSFGLDAAGQVYLADLNGGMYRLDPAR